LGNAGGVEIMSNGKPVGAIGHTGEARTIEFKAGAFRILTPDKPKPSQE